YAPPVPEEPTPISFLQPKEPESRERRTKLVNSARRISHPVRPPPKCWSSPCASCPSAAALIPSRSRSEPKENHPPDRAVNLPSSSLRQPSAQTSETRSRTAAASPRNCLPNRPPSAETRASGDRCHPPHPGC